MSGRLRSHRVQEVRLQASRSSRRSRLCLLTAGALLAVAPLARAQGDAAPAAMQPAPASESPAPAPTAAAPADAPPPAEAATEPVKADQEVLVTATRVVTPTSQIGSSYTTLDGNLIERRQAIMVPEVLRLSPGIDVVRSGGPGQFTSVFMRGANSNHTLLLIDGIEANDPSGFSGLPMFANLTTDNIERIEVLRGPQSGIWGSDAIGGVINIITKKGEGPPKFSLSAEGGSYETFREAVGVSGGDKIVNYSLNLSRLDSRGISAADESLGNDEEDRYGNTTFSSRLGFTPTDEFELDFITRIVDSRAAVDTDGGPPGAFTGDAIGRNLEGLEAYIKLEPRLILADGQWEQRFGLDYTGFRKDDPKGFTTDFRGDKGDFTWQHDLYFIDGHVLTAGTEFEYEEYEDSSVSTQNANMVSGFLQDHITVFDPFFVTVSGRMDHHSEFGSEFTWRAAPAYVIHPTGTKVKASYGTGFRAPSLPELYGPFGNRDLEAERSRGWDAGVEQQIFTERLVADVVYFRNDFDDLVQGPPIDNVGESWARGVEVGLRCQPVDRLAMRASYTHQDTDDGQGRDLLRRAEHKFGFDTSLDVTEKTNVTLSIAYVSDRDDIDPVTFARTVADSYTLVDLAATHKVTKNLTVYGRLENLLDEEYEPVAGFGAPGIGAYGGVRLTF
jgi:vitamin B12 transporter